MDNNLKKEVEDKIKDILNDYVKNANPFIFQIRMDYKTDNKNEYETLNLKDAKITEIIKIELIEFNNLYA